MRKGRSHRRTSRVSRPSLPGSDAHVESGGGAPQIMIGVSNAPSESQSEIVQAAAAEVLPVVQAPPPAPESGPEVSSHERSAPSAEADEPPPASEKRIALVRIGEDTLIDARPPVHDESDEKTESVSTEEKLSSFDPNAPVSKSTLIMGSAREAREEKAKDLGLKATLIMGSPEREVATRDSGDALPLSTKTSEPPPSMAAVSVEARATEKVSKDTTPGLGEKKTETLRTEKLDLKKVMFGKQRTDVGIEPTPTPSGMALPIDDEVSVPPIVNEPTLERFFSEGDLARHAVEEPVEEAIPERIKLKTSPHVMQRRARFSRYVTWAVGISAVVCLAAVARTALSPKAAPAPHAALAVAEPPVQPVLIAKDEPKPAQPVAVALAEPPKVEPKEAQPAADPAAAPVPSEAQSAAPAQEPPAGDAKEEKKNCKKLLERGKLKDAIEAGEKSVALDPTDGESWLLLGASYQEMGKLAEARRCYTACVKEGKTGPRHECAKMLR